MERRRRRRRTSPAALAAPGTTAVNVTSSTGSSVLGAPTAPPVIPSTATGGSTTLGLAGGFNNFGLESNTPNPSGTLALGVDPTVYLDEKKRFLEHLNQIRRINLGPDQNDSSGYGLYLVRMPVSITPGEKTYHGFGAEFTVTVEHEFTPGFVASTFRNLVINDVVDQLAPVIYEVIRTGLVDKFETPQYARAQIRALREQIMMNYLLRQVPRVTNRADSLTFVEPLRKFILRESLAPQVNDPDQGWDDVVHRLAFLEGLAIQALPKETATLIREQFSQIITLKSVGPDQKAAVDEAINAVVLNFLYASQGPQTGLYELRAPTDTYRNTFIAFLGELYETSLPTDVAILDDFFHADAGQRALTTSLASAHELIRQMARLSFPNLRSTRSAKQFYPISPADIVNVFRPENILVLAKEAKQSSLTSNPRATDVRSYLRVSLETAYNAMSIHPTGHAGQAPFEDTQLMNQICVAILRRRFDQRGSTHTEPHLPQLFENLLGELEQARGTMRDSRTGAPLPIAALCWAVAVDATLFNNWLQFTIPGILREHGVDRPEPVDQPLYLPDHLLTEEAKSFFCEFVKVRWPLITFALDPVTDQQNVADSFNLKRDLQLAVSFAFATGQISFGQLNTFRRQIEQSSDTIALNRTVTGFAHGNETFGFRFTPRVQNPPIQRTNLGVIASQLISGGPGPDYQVKKSKLEAGMRELTAVILVPTFLPSMRLNTSTNWFRLHDPEHLVFHSGRAMERGRQVMELQQGVQHACSLQQYRADDVRVLQAKFRQLEAMLPMQSKVIPLPYENTASGFDLFVDGATALVPELTGYDGVDIVTQGKPADIFIYGKYINLLDTRVIIGGAFVPNHVSAPATATQATQTTQTSTPTATNTGSTATMTYGIAGTVDILSREVVHVTIPATAIPTVTLDNKSYFEVYLATPNGISNRVLVPCQPGTTAPARVAYDLKSDSQELNIYYQWNTPAGGSPKLIVTDDPGALGKKPLSITWDDAVGFAPKTLQANFATTLSTGQIIQFSLPADSGTKDDYGVDRQIIAKTLLDRLQQSVPTSSALPASISMTITVQPYMPLDSMGYRVRTGAKPLATALTVKFIYYATGKDVLAGVTTASIFPPSQGTERRTAGRNTADASVVRTAQVALPPIGAGAQPPSTLPPMSLPPLPGSPLSSQPIPVPNTTAVGQAFGNLPPLPGALGPAGMNALSSVTSLTGAVTAAQVPHVTVNPAPVVVVTPAPVAPAKKHSRLSRLFNHKPTAPASR